MQKLLLSLVIVGISVSFAQANPAQNTLDFYTQQASAFPAQNTRANRNYAAALAQGLDTWFFQNAANPAAHDALLMQTRLWLRAQENGQALVSLFKLRYLFPAASKQTLLPLMTQALPALDSDSRAEASRLFEQNTQAQNPTAREADALYAFSKLKGRSFYPAAAAAFESFFKRNPSYSGNNEVELWYGDLHRVNGNYLAAITQYKKADALYPNSPYKAASMRLIGDIYADNLKDTESALEIYTQVLRDFPQSPETGIVYKHMAILDENNKQYDSALINYDKAIELLGTSSPASYEAFRGKADVYVKTKNYNEAYTLLHKTAVLFQADAEKSSQALQAAAKIAQKDLRDPQKYIQSLEKSLVVSPTASTNSATLYNLGQAYEENAQTAQAKEVYRKLILRYPTDKYASKAQKRLTRLEK